PLRDLHSFPTRRSSDLGFSDGTVETISVLAFGGGTAASIAATSHGGATPSSIRPKDATTCGLTIQPIAPAGDNFALQMDQAQSLDRKSTRLNSSHLVIS